MIYEAEVKVKVFYETDEKNKDYIIDDINNEIRYGLGECAIIDYESLNVSDIQVSEDYDY